MTTKAFNKRMHFIMQVANQGHDATVANEWFCAQTIADRRDISNSELVSRFLAWIPSDEGPVPN